MQNRKTKSPPHKLLSVNALSNVTGRDRRTIDKMLAGVAPASIVAGRKLYTLESLELAAKAKPDRGLREQKIAEEVRKLRIKNDRDEGKVIAVEHVMRVMSRILVRVDAMIEQKLSNEYPSAVAGMDVPQARIFGKRLGDQMRAELQSMGREWVRED